MAAGWVCGEQDGWVGAAGAKKTEEVLGSHAYSRPFTDTVLCTRHRSAVMFDPHHSSELADPHHSHLIDEELRPVYVKRLVQSQTWSVSRAELKVNAFTGDLSQAAFPATCTCLSSSPGRASASW